jgi:hypothetical protein
MSGSGNSGVLASKSHMFKIPYVTDVADRLGFPVATTQLGGYRERARGGY